MPANETSLLDHMFAETCKVAGAGAAGVDRGRNPGAAAEILGVDAERRAAPIDVGVQIDQPRSDDCAGHVAVVRSLGVQVGADAGDLAVCEGYVGHGIELLRGIDQARPSQDEVVGHCKQPPQLPARAERPLTES